ncbi:hypothetical protein EX30DRAFT_364820 [Ascodesmis nigricans]|uniref:LrgB-domain-containing protein n=1 Tax=Ascodesmis nigricans TaxID=341454 RepID=A0A4S2MTZ9_9PEZI|nr:hypothetical protein EX30DRAFT_364820 [Ascodesmis nigricans]
MAAILRIMTTTLQKLVPQLIRSYLFIPLGCIATLALCGGIDALLRLGHISFPASVLTMLTLSTALMIAARVFGERKVKRVVNVLDIPLGFASKHISIVFTPSFVLLPLSPSMGGMEAGMVIATFAIGFVAMFCATAFGVQGLQRVLGSEKARAKDHEHVDKVRGRSSPVVEETDDPAVELEFELERRRNSGGLLTPPTSSFATPASEISTMELFAPAPTAETSRVRGVGPVCTRLGDPFQRDIHPPQHHYQRDSAISSIGEKVASHVVLHPHTIIYSIVFLFVGLPVYYITGYTMPFHISITALCYHFSLLLPAKLKKFLHPVLTTSGLTLLLIYLFALTHQTSLTTALNSYSTGTRYLHLFRPSEFYNLALPGAGDLLSSLLDVSIISLSIPVYHHRHSLQRHLLPIALPSLLLSCLFLFLYPPITSRISISGERAKAFAARSVTLALATPAVVNLAGDVGFTALLTIMSGIVGVLTGPALMRLCRVKKEDYVTWGVVVGVNAGAIGTAWLLVGRGDPRAAAVSTMAMVAVGVGMVVLTSLPGMREAVEGLLGR